MEETLLVHEKGVFDLEYQTVAYEDLFAKVIQNGSLPFLINITEQTDEQTTCYLETLVDIAKPRFPQLPPTWNPRILEGAMYSTSNSSCPPHVDCIDGWVMLLSFGCTMRFHYHPKDHPELEKSFLFESGDAVIFRGSAAEGLVHWVDDLDTRTSPVPGLKNRRLLLQIHPKTVATPDPPAALALPHTPQPRHTEFPKRRRILNRGSPVEWAEQEQSVIFSSKFRDFLTSLPSYLDYKDQKSLARTSKAGCVITCNEWDARGRDIRFSFIDSSLPPAIVLDIGSLRTRCGFAGDDMPYTFYSAHAGDLVGNHAFRKPDEEITWPVQGVPEDDDRWRDLVQWCLESLGAGVSASEHPIMITAKPNTSSTIREKITEMTFESFDTPAFYLSNSGTLSLYAFGRTTGTVIEGGHRHVCVNPIYEGYELPHACFSSDEVGGQLVVERLKSKLGLSHRDAIFSLASRKEEVTSDNSYYEDIVETTTKLFENSVNACDIDIQQDLRKYCVPSGALWDFPFMNKLCNASRDSEPSIAPWLGGSILASLSTYKQMWISRAEYEERGPSIVRYRCM